MILLSGLVEFPVIYTHLPPRDSPLRDKFILFILKDCHSSLLRYDLDRANPLAMWHGIDNPSCKSFMTSFLTTSRIALLSLLCGSLDGEESGSIEIL